jgi:hypothetical protein
MNRIGLPATVTGDANEWIVTVVDDDGQEMVAKFSGLNSYHRAVEYGMALYPQVTIPSAPVDTPYEVPIIANPMDIGREVSAEIVQVVIDKDVVAEEPIAVDPVDPVAVEAGA